MLITSNDCRYLVAQKVICEYVFINMFSLCELKQNVQSGVGTALLVNRSVLAYHLGQ